MVGYSGASPSEWDCQVFITVVEQRSISRAAEFLAGLHPRGTYSRQAVSDVLAKIAAWAPQQLLEKDKDGRHWPTAAGENFLESARHVVAEYRLMREELPRRSLPTLVCLPHHLYLVTTAEDALANRPDAPSSTMHVQVVQQGHRHESALRRQLAEQLRVGRCDWVIGPWFEDQKTFRSETLYVTRLEAMVPARLRCDGGLSLARLVSDHELILPSSDLRSRRLLEEAVEEWKVVGNGRPLRVLDETAETWSSVLRLRLQDRSSSGVAQNRVLVTSSDVALAFRPDRELGGHGAPGFRWVPVYRADQDGTRKYLTYEVFLTSLRAGRPEGADVVRRALAEAAKVIESRFHLAGDPVGSGRRTGVPEQRRAPEVKGARR
jgi:DNA-binding transcriptional LysR family regulator